MMEPVVIITGASGGLGQELTRQFNRGGWRVAAGFHSSSQIAETEHLWPIQLDVTNKVQAGTVVQQVVDRWARVDVLINNAGLTADQPCWSLKDADWERVLAVNLKGAFLCSQAALEIMASQRNGHIINIASFSARAGQRGQSNYAAAKAGLIGLTESLAREYGLYNVRVNAVLPGVLPTRMAKDLSAEALDHLVSANTLGRINSLEEVARFVYFLAGMQNVSGQLFQLDSRIGRWA